MFTWAQFFGTASIVVSECKYPVPVIKRLYSLVLAYTFSAILYSADANTRITSFSTHSMCLPFGFRWAILVSFSTISTLWRGFWMKFSDCCE